MNRVPQISVVVCTRNRSPLLRSCLASLCLQRLSSDLFEVIIVDNGSIDDTEAVAASFFDKGPIRMIHEPIPGLSRARNTGWKNAASPFVGFIDDDAKAEQDWLEAALNCFKTVRPSISALGGRIDLEWEKGEPVWINNGLKKALSGLDLGNRAQFIQGRHFIVGANCFFQKEKLIEFGGFNVSLGRKDKKLMSSEEIDLQTKIERAGGLIYYHPDVKIRHFVPIERSKPGWFYRRYYWGGISDSFMKKQKMDSSNLGTNRSEPIGAHGRSPAERMIRNLMISLSPGYSFSKKVHSRIYLSYCMGYLIGMLRH